MKAHISVDCEASGPCPEYGSMISFGAVVIEPGLVRGHRSSTIAPRWEAYDERAYVAIEMSREQHLAQADQTLEEAMLAFAGWIESLGVDDVTFWSDNPAFDWQWINHGFAAAGLSNPFGYSARRIGDLYAGLKGSFRNTQGWKTLRRTVHDHDPLNDAKGNAEALLQVLEQYGQLDQLR